MKNETLSPSQIKEAVKNINIVELSKKSGVGYSSCVKLALNGGDRVYRTSTIEKISRYLLKEHNRLSEIYGLNEF